MNYTNLSFFGICINPKGCPPLIFINLQVFTGCPPLTFHQPKGFYGVPTSHFSSTQRFLGECPPLTFMNYYLLMKSETNLPSSNAKKPWYTLSIMYSINPRECPPLGTTSLGQAVCHSCQADLMSRLHHTNSTLYVQYVLWVNYHSGTFVLFNRK